MGGIGSGRQTSPAALIKFAKVKDSKNLPQYFDKLSELALNGDREALFYLIDRHMGKVKQSTEIEIKGASKLGEGFITGALIKFREERRKLIELEGSQEGSQDATE